MSEEEKKGLVFFDEGGSVMIKLRDETRNHMEKLRQKKQRFAESPKS
jgi:hypothetical protein